MQTLKIGGIIIGCLSLLFLALFFVTWIFIAFMIPLMLLMILSVISFQDEEIDLDVKRHVSKERVFENDEIKVTLEIENKGKNIHFLEMYDELPNKVEIVKGSNYTVLSLNKNEKITLEYTLSCKVRGYFPLGPLKLRIRDFFDLFYKEENIESETYLMVMPYLEELRDVPIKARTNLFPGMVYARQAGVGMEFHGLRKYFPGDNVKHINWKALAKFNNLMVNEFILESTTDVIIIIDSRDIESMGSPKQNPLEYSVKAGGSLASFFLKRRDRVGIIAYGKNEGKIKWVYPESGTKQLYKILEELVQIEADGEYGFNSMVNQASIHMLPKKSFIIFISSLQNDESISDGIQKLTGMAFNTLVLSPSSIDIEYSLKENDEIDDLAYKLLNFERKNNISRLRNTGAMVIDWNPSLPLEAPLEEVKKFQTSH
jgi:uncharacterized protein (DUF58 family)